MRKIIVAASLGLLALAATHARADTGMAQICTDATLAGHPAQDCINALTWDVPQAASLVLAVPVTSTSAPGNWAADMTWQTFGALNVSEKYRTCPLNLPRPSPHGGINGAYVGDQCGSSQTWTTATPSPTPIINGTATLSFTWAPPTLRDDDTTPFAANEVASYTLFWGASSRTGRACPKPVAVTDGACYPSHTQFAPGAAGGNLPLSLSATQTLYFALALTDTGGHMSDYSPELPVQFKLDVAPVIHVPKAPTSLSVTATVKCDAGPNVSCSISVTPGPGP